MKEVNLIQHIYVRLLISNPLQGHFEYLVWNELEALL